MSETSSFKFYATNNLKDIGRIYVIVTTAFKEDSNKLFSEYFIFIEADKKMLGMRFLSEPLEFYDLKIDVDFMQSRALDGAEAAIDNFVFEKYKDDNPSIHLSQTYSLKEWDLIPLIKILNGTTFHKEVSDLKLATKCLTLKDFMTKVWIELDDFKFANEELFK